jgi:hypothetical protein
MSSPPASPPAKRTRLLDEDNTVSGRPVEPVLRGLANGPNGRAREADVGITEYVDPSIPPFSAIIKHR